MKYICLTFDDGMKSHKYEVAPILDQYGIKATFFVNGEYCDIEQICYLNWNEIKSLYQSGHEVGSHFYFHTNHELESKEFNYASINLLELRLNSINIPKPKTICYPGFHYNKEIKDIIKKENYLFARSGCEKTLNFSLYQAGGSGSVFKPGKDDHYNIQCLGIFGQKYLYNEFKKDLEK